MSTIKANTLLHSDGSTTNPPAIPALDQRMAKAWVNFDQEGSAGIRSSYNVSSFTDTSAGRFTVHFASTLSTADHVWAGTAGNHGSTTGAGRDISLDGTMTTTSLKGRVTYDSSSVEDDTYVAVIVFSP